VRRVLRDDGTVWLNLGDSYASSSSYNTSQSLHTEHGWKQDGEHRPNVRASRADRPRGGLTGGTKTVDVATEATRAFRPGSGRADGVVDGRGQRNRDGTAIPGLKPKDLAGIPWRVAKALQEDGWYLRSEIIWSKVNPMPESVTDRPTKAHETVFLLAKQPRYFYDAEAVREEAKDWSRGGPGTGIAETQHYGAGNGGNAGLASLAARYKDGGVAPGRNMRGVWEIAQKVEDEAAWLAEVFAEAMRGGDEPLASTVWNIATQPYPAAHFATFPVELPSRCIRAGTSEKGCCATCGAGWARIVERGDPELAANTWSADGGGQYDLAESGRVERTTLKHVRANRTLGWQPTCACDGVDRTPIETPLGTAPGGDPTLEVGRAGFEREHAADEGVRYITRYEQHAYADQLRVALVERETMEAEAGKDAFAHYLRTDKSGARPVPHLLLESWIERGFVDRVEVPPPTEVDLVPAVVLDPFIGSGTTAVAALRLGRHAVGVELNPEYAALCEARVARWWKEPARAKKQDEAQPSLFEEASA
jgi:hypothetical protein